MIFVDELICWPGAPYLFRQGSCHLTTDGPLEELHAFAARIGMRREWFQEYARVPHYDLTLSRRKKALAAGAIFVSAMEQGRARRTRRLRLA